MPDVPLEKLLQAAFKGDDWRFLNEHRVFQEEFARQSQTTEGYEKLVEIGDLLLRQRDELSVRREK